MINLYFSLSEKALNLQEKYDKMCKNIQNTYNSSFPGVSKMSNQGESIIAGFPKN